MTKQSLDNQRMSGAKTKPDVSGLDHLAAMYIMRGVDLARVHGLLLHCPVRKLIAGEVLITPGEQASRIYLLLSGRLRVHLGNTESKPLALLNAGESVGELSMIDEHPRSSFVVADDPASVLEISRRVFWSLVHSSHEFTINLLTILCKRIRGNNMAFTDIERLKEKFEHYATMDGLTGLNNRRWLNDTLSVQVSRSSAGGSPLSVIMADVDHFKKFNDVYGHAAGDLVLVTMGQMLRELFRSTDLVARFGGEEFTVILPDTKREDAQILAERVRLAISEKAIIMPDQTNLPAVTISLGIAELEKSQTDEQLLEAADKALYRAKNGGRNRTSF